MTQENKEGLTWADLVNRFWGPATEEEMDSLLWCGSCFPFGSVLQVARQLRRLKKLSGGDFEKAMEITHKEFDEEFEQVCATIALEEKNKLATEEERAMIAERAFERYVRRGCKNGSAKQDWLEAEKELFPWRFQNE